VVLGRSTQAFLKFLDAVEEALERLISHGDTFASIGRGCRAIRVKDFPHRIIYFIRPSGTIRIVAIPHDRRRPQYWSRRIKGN
jgi:plasmid stabilization system protein ParE